MTETEVAGWRKTPENSIVEDVGQSRKMKMNRFPKDCQERGRNSPNIPASDCFSHRACSWALKHLKTRQRHFGPLSAAD
jgi:hypothetical protein